MTKLRLFYLLLSLLSLCLTWYYNIQYLSGGGGLGPHEFFGTAFANPLTTAITIDVYLAGLCFAVFAIVEAKRHQMRHAWLYVVMCFAVGLAIALPLFLAMREKPRAAASRPLSF